MAVTVAPSGAEVTRADNPAVPYLPSEIASEALDAQRAGATVVHLHVREPDGRPSARPELFVEVMAQIRDGSQLVTMVSTGGSVEMSLDQRLAGLEARPDMASLETGSMNFGEDLFATLPSQTREIAERIKAAGAVPEIEVFEIGHVDSALRLQKEGVLAEPLRINTVLGVRGGMAATPGNFLAMRDAVPPGAIWGVTVIGRRQWRILALAVLLGADYVRVGMEDNVFLDTTKPAPSNAALVAKLRAIAEGNGRAVATPEEVRAVLALPESHPGT